MKAKVRVNFVIAGVLLMGCGRQNDTRDDQASRLSNDSGASEAAVASSFNETMDSMSDSNMNSGGSALALAAAGDVHFEVERNCTANDGKALVTLDVNKEVSYERKNARVEVTAAAKVQSEISRTWAKEGSTVGCLGDFAAINFEADLTGYELDVAVKRSADRSLERKVIRTGESSARELKTAVEGSRHVQWLSQENQADGSISRTHALSFKVERSDSFLAKDGTIKDLALTVETSQDLQVTVTWDKLTRARQLLSKLIASGSVKASHGTDSYVEASFDHILMKFEAASCSVVSGSMQAKVYATGSSDPAKIYLLTATDGTIAVQDVTDPAHPQDVDDFDYSPCDLKDFNY